MLILLTSTLQKENWYENEPDQIGCCGFPGVQPERLRRRATSNCHLPHGTCRHLRGSPASCHTDASHNCFASTISSNNDDNDHVSTTRSCTNYRSTQPRVRRSTTVCPCGGPGDLCTPSFLWLDLRGPSPLLVLMPSAEFCWCADAHQLQ
ncbi:hypothetical protein AAKU67_000084 [Oxalobacteraceae bacterium GrIS 2.11]